MIAASDGRILRFNKAAVELTGYSDAELADLRVENLVPPRQRAAHEVKRAQFMHAGEQRRPMGAGLLIELLRKDGTRIPVDIALAQIEFEGSQAVVATIRDITERRLTEARLQQQAALLEVAHDAILVRRAGDGVILYWNQGAVDLYGYGSGEAVGQVAQELLHTTFPGSLAGVLAAIERDGHWEGELVHSRRDGSRVNVSSRWVLMRPEGHMLEINRDVSAEKRMHEQLAVVADRERLARELHDGIIQAVFGVGLSLQAGASTTTDEALRTRLVGAIEALDQVTRDLRNFIFELRQPRGRTLTSVLDAVAERIQTQSGLLIVNAIDDRIQDLPASLLQEMALITGEALTNTVRHGAARSARVTVGSGDGELTIEIEDDGRGFDITAPTAGSGLRNMRERSTAMGGTFEVHSSVGDGTRVTLRLPLPARDVRAR